MPSQGQEGPSRPAHHNASVASSTVVSNAPRNADRTTNIVTTKSEHFDVTSRRVTSIGDNEQPTTSCMESFGENLVSKGFSRESSKLLSEARRPGTQLAYAGPWKKWCRWCRERKVDPLQAPVEQIANFLLRLGLEYATLNSYRSAISAYHLAIEGYRVGQHPMIKQLM